MTDELAPAVTFHVVNSLGWPDLRPLQKAAIEPLRGGRNALLVAPTAGGKTEAAMLPLLSEMIEAPWHGLSILYVTPLRALLNNLYPRLTTYAQWVGRTVGLWHGDVGSGERRRIRENPPDILLTTPESLEAMLVSTKVDHEHLFADLRALVVDELHAFAGDDRGWHLLAVAERLERIAGWPLQRVGMSATVGNPRKMLAWMTRSELLPEVDKGVIVAPGDGEAVAAGGAAEADVSLDYVGTVDNAAKVIELLHPGEKRLVFCQSRSQTEELATALRAREVLTVVSHSSMAAEERRQAEKTFAEASECVMVATSTLELGVDIGDLHRMIQIDAPHTVASFLQRMGRTGRREGTNRNALYLATNDRGLVQAAALLDLWGAGFVEQVVPPPEPAHIAAQQFLALALQEGRFALNEWRGWWPGLAWMQEAEEVLEYLLAEGYLATDGGFAFVGVEAEEKFGRRNFLELTSVFTAAPEFKVLHGRMEVGTVSPLVVSKHEPDGKQAVLSLGGRSWAVNYVDWRRRQVFVAPDDKYGRSVWTGGTLLMGPELADSIRRVLAGSTPSVQVSARASNRLAIVRDERRSVAVDAGTAIQHEGSKCVWWTWAGSKANNSLAAGLAAQGIEATADGLNMNVAVKMGATEVRDCAVAFHGDAVPEPLIDAKALDGLKFSALLPEELARRTLVARLTDAELAADVAAGMVTVVGAG